jgi:cold shock CspA family protein
MREAGSRPSDLSDMVSRGDDSSSDYSGQDDVEDDYVVAPSLCSIDIPHCDEKQYLVEHDSQERQDKTVSKTRTRTDWDEYNEQRMQGIVSYTNPEMGYGFILNPNVKKPLFFHASQLRVPVKNLEGNIVKDMLLDFIVEKLTERTRAADIRVSTVRKREILPVTSWELS